MKGEILLLTSLSVGCVFGIWGAIAFRGTQEETFCRVEGDRNFLQQDTKTLRADLAFLESHQKEIDFLRKKGWEFPKNRLSVSECLEKLRPLSLEISYRFDPEISQDLAENFSFKVTQIVFEMTSPMDREMYAFIDKILERFPGILVPRELTMTRQGEGCRVMKGKFVVDWFAMGEDGHEN